MDTLRIGMVAIFVVGCGSGSVETGGSSGSAIRAPTRSF
jgi:hypothetical protein